MVLQTLASLLSQLAFDKSNKSTGHGSRISGESGAWPGTVSKQVWLAFSGEPDLFSRNRYNDITAFGDQILWNRRPPAYQPSTNCETSSVPVAFDSFAVQRDNVVLKGNQHSSKQLQHVSVVFGRSLLISGLEARVLPGSPKIPPQAIGACDKQVRTTDDNAPYRNGRPGIARELQSASPGVPRSA